LCSIFLVVVLSLFCINISAASELTETLEGRIILGYQGWNGCPKDFEDNKVWQHWFVMGVALSF
jgi:hypothetical protein